jgi:signal transduction histidine kinase
MIETLKTGKSAHVIHELNGTHNLKSYANIVTYPLKNPDGEISKVMEIWRDITEEIDSRWQKRVAELKADLNKIIQEDRMISLGKLAASCVHQINNPLQGLLTFTHLMQNIVAEETPGPEDMKDFRQHLSLMSDELERCGKIVSGLLSFSRTSSVEFTDLDLNEILKEVMTLTKHKMDLQNIQLTADYSDRPLRVQGDGNQLQQCFLNLIFNAIEAMPQGGRLNLISKFDPKDKKAHIEINDTGPGIPDEHLQNIFDPFFTTKEEGEGTGLGLSIVYGIIKNHCGDIKVNSLAGKGCSFLLSFPIL